jgi:LPS export ABC transporter protein LptC
MAGMFFSCENDLRRIGEVTEQHNDADQSMTEVTLTVTDSGRMKLKMVSDTVLHYEEEQMQVWPNGLNVYFYNDEGLLESELKADQGKLFQEEKKMEVQYDVVLYNHTNQEKLLAEYLILREDSIFTKPDEKVRIIRSDSSIVEGYWLRANEDFTDYSLDSVNIKYTIDQEEIIEDNE